MPTCATQPSLERTRAVADILFTQFARQRFNQAGFDDELPDGEDRFNDGANDVDRLVEAQPIMASYGVELRRIAKQFEQTRERQKIKARANGVLYDILSIPLTVFVVQTITNRNFISSNIFLINMLDVALKAVSFGSDLVSNLLRWSLNFIKDQVCLWVHEIGGWDVVLCRYVPSVLVSTLAILGICALYMCYKQKLWP